MSELVLRESDCTIRIKINCRYSPKMRRAFLLSFFKMIRPGLNYFESYFRHEEHLASFNRDKKFPLSILRSPDIITNHGKFGLEVRVQRLKLKLTQLQLAQLIKTSRCRISLIERGLSVPQPKTYEKIAKILWRTAGGNFVYSREATIREPGKDGGEEQRQPDKRE